MAKFILFVLLLLPFCLLLNDLRNAIVVDPIETITNTTGQWALRFLLLTLSVSPLSQLSGYSLVRFRRMIGLFSFFYALLHISIWLIDQQFSVSFIIEDIIKRSYITVGFVAFLMLLTLALTSTVKIQKRLGRKWKQLHRLIYVIIVLAVIHFYWQAKSSMDIEPMIYAAIALLLLVLRLPLMKKVLIRKYGN